MHFFRFCLKKKKTTCMLCLIRQKIPVGAQKNEQTKNATAFKNASK